jgi:hypothetical protein
MKLKVAIPIASWVVCMACNAGNEKTVTPSEPVERVQKRDASPTCYQYASPTDTITLKLVPVGEAITGTLVYQLSGKDKNIGTVQGKMNGDILVAKYIFNSEGMSSTREVAFKRTNGNFIEGYGEVNVENNDVRFKDINNLQFNEGFRLVPINCQ